MSVVSTGGFQRGLGKYDHQAQRRKLVKTQDWKLTTDKGSPRAPLDGVPGSKRPERQVEALENTATLHYVLEKKVVSYE